MRATLPRILAAHQLAAHLYTSSIDPETGGPWIRLYGALNAAIQFPGKNVKHTACIRSPRVPER